MNSISHGGKQDGSSKDAASANPANPSPCHAALGCLPDSIVTWFLCLSFSFYPEETWTDDGKICFSPFSETTHVYSALGKYWLGDLTDEVLGVRPSEKETFISVKWLPPVDGEVISFFTEELVIAKNDAEVEVPILWSPAMKSWLIGKDPDAGKDWGQEEKGTTEDEMVGWHHWLNAMGVSLSKLREIVKDREAWRAAVEKSQRQLSNWTTAQNALYLFIVLDVLVG